MKIIDLLKDKQNNMNECKPVTIAFLGDSVTQGCFECYLMGENKDIVETVFETNSSYGSRVKEILNKLYPKTQINIINSGISGDTATGGLKRLERDVLSYNPDLCVVSFGLNDSCVSNIDDYTNSLNEIFKTLKERSIEFIFLTQNSMCINTSPRFDSPIYENLSKVFTDIQNSGKLKTFMEAAKKKCIEYGGKVCDLYSTWEKLINAGVDVTELLANKLNHPIREFHYYMALELIETMLED